MKIYKDILEYLKIESVHVNVNGISYFGVPLEIEDNIWILALDRQEEIIGNGLICIRKENEIFEWKVKLETVSNDKYAIYTCIHKATLIEEKLDERSITFIKEIKNVELETNRWNKRKEERFTIKEDIEIIGFDSAEQQIITKDDTFPCFVNNVSYSGSQVVTYCSYMPAGKIICLNLGFKNPVERIPIKAVVRHYQEITGDNGNKFAVVSMEFEHPPLSWQHRMTKLIENVKKINKR